MALSLRTLNNAPAEPGPFFLSAARFEGAPVALALDPARWSGEGVDLVDNSALSGEVFLRLTWNTSADGWSLRLPESASGTLVFEVRSRQQTAGSVAWTNSVIPVHPNTEWAEVRVGMPECPADRTLRMALSDEGAWELRNLRIVPFDRAGYEMARQEQAKAPLPNNLLSHSRFLLGLPDGWTLARDLSLGEDLHLQADLKVRGPSGCPALELRATSAGYLRSPPVSAWNLQEHAASIWIQGRGEGELIVREAGGRLLSRHAFTAEAHGQTVDVRFMPPDLSTWILLELSWFKTGLQVWIDAPRIAPVGADAAQIGRAPAEIALKADARGNLFFDEQLPAFQFFVSGADAGAELCWRVLDIRGGVCGGTLELSADDLQIARAWTPDLKELATRGSFRITAWITSPQSPGAELIFHCLPSPTSNWKSMPESTFGIHVLPTSQHLYLAKSMGLNWARLHGPGSEINYWYYLEPEPGQWYARPERLALYRDAGFSVLGKLTSSPRWASGQTERVHGYFDQFVGPKDWPAWRGYVRKLIESYGADIDLLEIWNEPWLDKFFSQRVEMLPDGSRLYVPFANPAEVYTRMVRETAEAVRESGRNVLLIGLNTTTNRDIAGWVDGDQWTRQLQEAGGLEPVDIYSYHDYNSSPEAAGQSGVSREGFGFALGPVLDAAGKPPKPVWNTEGSPQPGGISPGLYKHLLPSPADDVTMLDTVWAEAERVARYFLAQRVCGVEKVFFYTMHNFHGFGGPSSFTVFLGPDGSLHPTGAALAVLAKHFDGLDFVEVQFLPGGSLLLFAGKDGRAAEALLFDVPTEPPASEAGWVDLFGNPVQAGDQADERAGRFFFCQTSPSFNQP